MTEEQIEELALIRANEILESWWGEDLGEFQYENDLTDEELDKVYKTNFDITIR